MTDDTSSSTETLAQNLAQNLAKTFEPAAIEARWYAHWESNGLFRPDRPDAVPFTIVNPPPNVTGSLHIGHALDNTLQDVVIRYERLRGRDALWVVGTDHAGIATQMVVERQLEARQDKRTNYTREDFIAKVWEWKAESGGTITGQLRRLGCSMDWSREQFTMDPHFTKAVVKVFVDLYNAKDSNGRSLIYRDKRLVNWDPKLKSAISDLEVEAREVKGQMWHFKYPLADGLTYRYVERDADGAIVIDEQRDYIAIATTRPETMLGDGAVAVHPDDQRYASIVGKLCEIPVGPKAHRRRIPIITDLYPDPAFGSGAVKITGAHDQNDYGVAQRNGIPLYRLMDEAAQMRTDGDAYAQSAARAGELAAGAPALPGEIDQINLVPTSYRGLDRAEARKQVIAEIDAEGLMIGVEDKIIMQPFGDRSGVVIEPMLTDQWYVNAAELAKAPMAAVRSGAIEIVPKTWEKTFFNWMENIQPWCVSRQLWWGHRIPAWYGFQRQQNGSLALHIPEDGEPRDPGSVGLDDFFVCETENDALHAAEAHYAGREVVFVSDRAAAFAFLLNNLGSIHSHAPIWRDPDVLDTWFSSALWPFATLGWPEDPAPLPLAGGAGGGQPDAPTLPDQPTPNPSRKREGDLLARHYPNDLLISGFDILFFWDARMAMQGMKFMGQVPWKRLYLHGLVRAADGQKMSKSKGNVVDPLLLIDKFGADALRFFMAAMESQGRDVKMDERRVEGYRNFATKLWNAARFCQSNGIGASTSLAAPAAELAVNKWIIGEVVTTLADLDKAMADLRFDAAANAIYHFVWDTFCDWYIELIKGQFDDETKAVAGWVLDQILVMLHPFMPFVTEELWASMGERESELIVARWPEPDAAVDAAAKAEVEWLIMLVGNLRGAKAELGIAPGAKLEAWLAQPSATTRDTIAANGGAIDRLARLSAIHFESAPAGAAMQIGAGDASFVIPLEGVIDIAAEKARLAKALETSTREARSLEGRLNNPAFVAKAKPEAVEKARADHAVHAAEAERLAAALARLG